MTLQTLLDGGNDQFTTRHGKVAGFTSITSGIFTLVFFTVSMPVRVENSPGKNHEIHFDSGDCDVIGINAITRLAGQ